jgi:hypothetical protein
MPFITGSVMIDYEQEAFFGSWKAISKHGDGRKQRLLLGNSRETKIRSELTFPPTHTMPL